jgi:spermidine synthase
VRVVVGEADVRRRGLAIVYGMNTLGAVMGALLATFFMLEILGTRATIWAAGCVNMLLAVVANAMARKAAPVEVSGVAKSSRAPAASLRFVLGSAAIVGFAFFLMEMVWYRLLGPLLGGSVFTFGLILAVVLLGIGVGGLLYALLSGDRRATVLGLALTCALEAVAIALPFALGDDVAILALTLREWGAHGFAGLASSWFVVAAVLIFPAAVIAGIQFPLLVNLLGQGQQAVGTDLGTTYAFNTMGAILGVLLGGFGLLPWLGVNGCWMGVVGLLAALALAAALVSGQRRMAWAPIGISVLALALMMGSGPSAAWRHQPIGAGRVQLPDLTPQTVKRWQRKAKRLTRWEVEGKESSIAVLDSNSLTLAVNGKSDGNVIGDAATFIMLGVLGPILHPAPRTALVIGLGTGETTGWLGALERIERVDSVELEPAVMEVARMCSVANKNVMENPRVHHILGDAREVLHTTPRRYDVIISQPSNPYRAGISSLLTVEFYHAVRERLNEGGLFVQWIQAYEISLQTMATNFATLSSEFTDVTVWQTDANDLLLVASAEPQSYDRARLEARIQEPVVREALQAAWRTSTLEGVFARFITHGELVRKIAVGEGDVLNSDDHQIVEFDYGRSVSEAQLFSLGDFQNMARSNGTQDPPLLGEPLDEMLREREWLSMYAGANHSVPARLNVSPGHGTRVRAFKEFLEGRWSQAVGVWDQQTQPPQTHMELLLYACGLAARGEPSALKAIEQLRTFNAVEADGVWAWLLFSQQRHEEAAEQLKKSLLGYREDPWAHRGFMRSVLMLVSRVSSERPDLGRALFGLLFEPFAADALNRYRRDLAVEVSEHVGFEETCAEALGLLEPHVPWVQTLLERRVACYESSDHPLLERARAELAELLDEL